ncbi:hypothetical protein LZ32DRAFT_600092, partial [Colletotrichum eremochloae]
MFDDTRVPDVAKTALERPQGAAACLRSNIAEILSHSIIRSHADSWSRNLRFLTFDDDGGKASAYAEDAASSTSWTVDGQCKPCQDKLPVENGHICADHMLGIRKYGAHLPKSSNTCIHVQQRTCQDCIPFPLFPNHGRVTRFRIRRLRRQDSQNLSDCNHFIAASYCWNSPSPKRYATDEDDGAEQGPYQVIEEDGSRRDMRANRYTVDRLVEFARGNGFRMIWIDQECIEQDDPVKKELAIQAMDLVYSRAGICVGLMTAELEQAHLDCLLLVFERLAGLLTKKLKRRGVSPFLSSRSVDLNVLAEAVSRVVNDKWNTRAWVLQEAFASSGRMVLLFPRAPSIKVSGWLLICHELSRSELAIELDRIQVCLEHAKELAYGAMTKAIDTPKRSKSRDLAGNEGLDERYKPLAEQTSEEIRLTMARLRFFHPRGPENGWRYWTNTDLPRRVCNAAMSLTYLQLRDLTEVSDKLAIVANLGGYARHLNTYALRNTQTSLSVCVLALALVNGDSSLLTPEIYSKSLRQTLEYPQVPNPEFSWRHSGTRKLELIESVTWNRDSIMSVRNTAAQVDISEQGLSIPGFLWEVDEFIKLETFLVKYADPWRRLTTSIDTGRKAGATRNFEKATTHILFELIQYLHSNGHDSVANAIWNSTANWNWKPNRQSKQDDIVESVDQFPQGLQVENRGGMFSLDPSPDGRYFQCWIIDRIMSQGGIWVARVIPPPPPPEPDTIVTSPSDPSDAPISEDEETRDKDSQGSLEGERRTHSQYMRTLHMLVTMMPYSKRRAPARDFSVDSFSRLTSENMSLFAAEVHRRRASGADNYAGQRAVFDVEMPENGQGVWILTPFELELESIPIPERRAHSVARVVDPVLPASKAPVEGGSLGPTPMPTTLRTRLMTRGMWPFQKWPMGKWKL